MFEASFEATHAAVPEPPPLPAVSAGEPAVTDSAASDVAAEPDVIPSAAIAAEAADAAPIAFDSDEAADVVAFEAMDVVPDPALEPADAEPASDTAQAAAATEPPAIPAIDPGPPSAPEDRVMLQFAASVPPDLAELRRIAADNQW
jgi:hypothetical protein